MTCSNKILVEVEGGGGRRRRFVGEVALWFLGHFRSLTLFFTLIFS